MITFIKLFDYQKCPELDIDKKYQKRAIAVIEQLLYF